MASYDLNPLSDEAVDRLIRIVNSDTKLYRRHWYFFWIPIAYEYCLDEQLEALEILGQSRNLKALDYVEKLSKTEDLGYNERGSCGDADEIYIVHPHAHGKLAEALCSASPAPCRQWDSDYNSSFKSTNPRAVLILETALSQLKKDLSK